MRRVFWILLTPLAGILILWVIGALYLAPALESWTLKKIHDYSESSLPVRIQASRLHLKLFKPSLSLEDIRIQGKGELAQGLPEIHVESVRVFPDFFQLIAGKLNLSAVVIDTATAEINLDPFLNSDKPPQALPIDEIFAQTEKIPLQRLLLRNAQVKVFSRELKFSTVLNSGDVLVTNMGKNLTLKTSVPELKLDIEKAGSFKGSLDTHLYLTRQSLRILQLGVRLNESALQVRGELNPIAQVTLKPAGNLQLTSDVKLDEIHAELLRLRPDLKLPRFGGELKSEGEVRFNGLDDIRGKAEIQTTSVSLGKLQLGDARVQGEYRNQVISFSEVELSHPSGEATVSKSQLSLKGDYDFQARVAIKSLDLQKLFQSLNLNDIPVGMRAQGTLPCEGKIFPEIQARCTGIELTGSNIWVRSGLDKKSMTILELDQVTAKGDAEVNTKSFTYKAQLAVGTSQGVSDGVVDFASGFKINFATPELDFKNVKNLANLQILGAASIEGQTSGDSHAAIFDLNLNARNFLFENFFLGNLISTAKYRGGLLSFNDIAGAINRTQYLGNLTLDLNQNTLQGEFTAPTTELSDVATALKDFYRFPLNLAGQGSAKARLSGPLDFWKMNYQLESAFRSVTIGTENFDVLNFNVSASEGNIKADQVHLSKGDSLLTVSGGISSAQVMNLLADGKNWKLEQSDLISKVNSNLVGTLNFSAELTESIQNPQILARGAITDTAFQDQEIPNSNFVVRINKDSFASQVSLFGDKVRGEIQWPFPESRAPLIIKMQTQEWSYSSLLGLIGGANLAAEYESNLTSSVDLRSESGDLFKSTGTVQIDTLSLKRGGLSFANPKPISLTANNGLITLKDFLLTGPSNNMQIRGENFTVERLDLNVALQSDLRLLQIFLPFLEDLGGQLQLSATVSSSLWKPQILGNLNTENAFIKLKGLPHPIERLSVDVVFSQSKIMISSIRGNIAGGTIVGDGAMLINGVRDLPTSVRLRLEGVTFNVPDKIRSSGRADLLLSGRWFPFTLSGTYQIASALVEKEFTEEDGAASGVRQSSYLPKVIRESQFEPIVLDLQLVLERNIIVRNSLLDGSVSGNLQVKGPPTQPVLLGRINADPRTKLIFKDKIFEIQNGVIDFNDPDEINPNLYITAQSRINEYDVMLLAQGLSKNLTIRLSSVPPLPESEIISLIALGVTSSNMDRNMVSGEQAQQLGTEIGGAVLAKPLNKGLESVTGFNLSVTSQYDSTRNISVPKITISRRLTDRLKVSGSRPVRDTQDYDIKLEYLLNSNITAIGSFENRGPSEDSTTLQTNQPTQNIFGLDLEFKREFK